MVIDRTIVEELPHIPHARSERGGALLPSRIAGEQQRGLLQ